MVFLPCLGSAVVPGDAYYFTSARTGEGASYPPLPPPRTSHSIFRLQQSAENLEWGGGEKRRKKERKEERKSGLPGSFAPTELHIPYIHTFISKKNV